MGKLSFNETDSLFIPESNSPGPGQIPFCTDVPLPLNLEKNSSETFPLAVSRELSSDGLPSAGGTPQDTGCPWGPHIHPRCIGDPHPGDF